MPRHAMPRAPIRAACRPLALGMVFLLAARLPLSANPNEVPAQEQEIRVNVIKGGAGKFNQANITREENKVIQGAFSGGPGSSLESIIAAPDGTLYLCGFLSGNPSFPLATTPGGGAFVARVSRDARTIEASIRLPAEFLTARCLALSPDGTVVVAGERDAETLVVARLAANLDRVLWTHTAIGDRAVSVAVAPDSSVIVCPNEKPFVSRIAADGSALIPFGTSDTFRTDGGNPDVYQAWWVGCGYVEAGYTRGATYHRGGSGGVVALKDGTFVLFTTNFLHHPGGGPDFDPMLLRFDGSGKILWCTNLLEGLPAESDHKQARMSLDPHSGDLLLAAVQHGHFPKNLLLTPGAMMRTDNYFTGNIMIGWIARVDPATGQPRASTFYFPEIPGPLVTGKKKANSLFPLAPVADEAGNIYVTGRSAYKFATTLHAFQSDADSGAFISVFTPGLNRLLYASLVSSPGCDIEPCSIAVAPGGPVVTGRFSVKDGEAPEFVGANTDVTNYLVPRPAGTTGGFLSYHPSSPWKR